MALSREARDFVQTCRESTPLANHTARHPNTFYEPDDWDHPCDRHARSDGPLREASVRAPLAETVCTTDASPTGCGVTGLGRHCSFSFAGVPSGCCCRASRASRMVYMLGVLYECACFSPIFGGENAQLQILKIPEHECDVVRSLQVPRRESDFRACVFGFRDAWLEAFVLCRVSLNLGKCWASDGGVVTTQRLSTLLVRRCFWCLRCNSDYHTALQVSVLVCCQVFFALLEQFCHTSLFFANTTCRKGHEVINLALRSIFQ